VGEKKIDPVTQYAKDVKAGKIQVGELVRLACERHLKLLKQAKLKGYRFDLDDALYAIGFFSFLKHSKGKWAGNYFILEPWQEFIIGYIFGWKNADGTRLVRVAYIEVPRKNGKSCLAAGTGLYLFVADGEPGAEIYSAATKKDQARIVFEEAQRMVKRSELSEFVNSLKSNLSWEETFSKFEPLGADKDTMDGLNIHGALIDELHAHKDRGVWDVIITATGSREQPLTFVITTAGLTGESICREQHDYCERILKGIIEDDTYFSYIATIDEGDDWADEKSWWKANPNLGVSKKLETVRADCKKALENPTFQNTFRRYHLNEWTQQETRWMDIKKWDDSASIVPPEKLFGKKCFGALDLANRVDIAAFDLVFPTKSGDYKSLSYFWIPKENMLARSRKDRVPYEVWARQGYIEATEGDVIDYTKIKADIIALSKVYDIEEIAFDPWNATQMAQELDKLGFTMVETRQGYKTMNEPTKELMRLILDRKMHHGGNPVLRWMADNLVIVTDDAGNIKPSKDKSREKIDGIVALVMALSRAMYYMKKPMPYLDRGITFI